MNSYIGFLVTASSVNKVSAYEYKITSFEGDLGRSVLVIKIVHKVQSRRFQTSEDCKKEFGVRMITVEIGMKFLTRTVIFGNEEGRREDRKCVTRSFVLYKTRQTLKNCLNSVADVTDTLVEIWYFSCRNLNSIMILTFWSK